MGTLLFQAGRFSETDAICWPAPETNGPVNSAVGHAGYYLGPALTLGAPETGDEISIDLHHRRPELPHLPAYLACVWIGDVGAWVAIQTLPDLIDFAARVEPLLRLAMRTTNAAGRVRARRRPCFRSQPEVQLQGEKGAAP